MDIYNISVPEVYQNSGDFRFFLKWISLCFSRIQYDIENLIDLYDCQRCPSNLLWMLADTIGYKYDDRFPPAYIRLVLLYFMSLIRNRGSKDGVTLAAELNLAQFVVDEDGKQNNINYDRLKDTSIPVQSAYVTPNTEAGYIDVVYFSDRTPVDACIEYVRPLGMYCFQSAGVRFDAKTKISIDAKLANYVNGTEPHSITATHVGQYKRKDYAQMQQTGIETSSNVVYNRAPKNMEYVADTFYIRDATTNTYTLLTTEPEEFDSNKYFLKSFAIVQENDVADVRDDVYYRNSVYEGNTNPHINHGYRALSSLQLCNHEGIVRSLVHQDIFSLGYTADDVSTYTADNVIKKEYNLLYDIGKDDQHENVATLDMSKPQSTIRPVPMVNPIMGELGDAIAVSVDGANYHTKYENGEITLEEDEPIPE